MISKYKIEVTAFAEASVRSITDYIRNELKAPQAAQNTVRMLFDAINKLDTFPNKIKLTEEEPWHTEGVHQMAVENYYVYFWINEPETKGIITDVIYAKRDQKDALADMSMT